MNGGWKGFLEDNKIVAVCEVDPDNDEEVIYICRDCITEEDFPEDGDDSLEYPFRTESDLTEDEVFVGISQYRPVRCYRCGKEILAGYSFAQFPRD